MKLNNQLVLLLKEPELGKVKTRLGSEVGMQVALEIYIGFLKMLASKVFSPKWNTSIHFSATKNPVILKSIFGATCEYHIQIGETLGERMQNAFKLETGSKKYPQKICLIGGDSPDLPKNIFSNCFKALEKQDVVLGPTTDGGYYLIGMNKLSPELFQNIKWSTNTVYDDTIKILNSTQKSYSTLMVWEDVDTLEDFHAFLQRVPAFPNHNPNNTLP